MQCFVIKYAMNTMLCDKVRHECDAWQLKRSAHERQKEHFQSGEFSSGQKWADDAPREDVDPDAVSLISSGACGAFVHGLEDEYLGQWVKRYLGQRVKCYLGQWVKQYLGQWGRHYSG